MTAVVAGTATTTAKREPQQQPPLCGTATGSFTSRSKEYGRACRSQPLSTCSPRARRLPRLPLPAPKAEKTEGKNPLAGTAIPVPSSLPASQQRAPKEAFPRQFYTLSAQLPAGTVPPPGGDPQGPSRSPARRPGQPTNPRLRKPFAEFVRVPHRARRRHTNLSHTASPRGFFLGGRAGLDLSPPASGGGVTGCAVPPSRV